MGRDGAPWSMTGYGLGRGSSPAGSVEVQVRTVNHRHADLRVKVAPELAEHAAWLEERLRDGVRRGRAEVTVRWEGTAEHGVQLDVERARTVYQQLAELRDELDAGQPVPLSLLGSVPGLFRQTSALDEEQTRTVLATAADAALSSLNEMRQREGQALCRDLLSRLDILDQEAGWIEARRPEVIDSARERLRARLSKLLEGSHTPLDEGRLEHEIALFADRSDIAEELTRLASHTTQFRSLLHSGGEPVGRKLEFLLQEMGREVNTIGSKANDAGIAQRVVLLKAELERMREQVQNVL